MGFGAIEVGSLLCTVAINVFDRGNVMMVSINHQAVSIRSLVRYREIYNPAVHSPLSRAISTLS
jgi:hypothetical protein